MNKIDLQKCQKMYHEFIDHPIVFFIANKSAEIEESNLLSIQTKLDQESYDSIYVFINEVKSALSNIKTYYMDNPAIFQTIPFVENLLQKECCKYFIYNPNFWASYIKYKKDQFEILLTKLPDSFRDSISKVINPRIFLNSRSFSIPPTNLKSEKDTVAMIQLSKNITKQQFSAAFPILQAYEPSLDPTKDIIEVNLSTINPQAFDLLKKVLLGDNHK